MSNTTHQTITGADERLVAIRQVLFVVCAGLLVLIFGAVVVCLFLRIVRRYREAINWKVAYGNNVTGSAIFRGTSQRPEQDEQLLVEDAFKEAKRHSESLAATRATVLSAPPHLHRKNRSLVPSGSENPAETSPRSLTDVLSSLIPERIRTPRSGSSTPSNASPRHSSNGTSPRLGESHMTVNGEALVKSLALEGSPRNPLPLDIVPSPRQPPVAYAVTTIGGSPRRTGFVRVESSPRMHGLK